MSEKVKAMFSEDNVITENSTGAQEFFNQGRFGELKKDGRVILSMVEAYFLIEKEKLEVFDARNRVITDEQFLKRAKRKQPTFTTKFAVFRDLRDRGYIVKTALKFGADFRVYDRGVKPGDDHARWVVFPVHESSVLTWHEFSAKNRVAHSTKKRLLLGVVDDEGDVSYWETKWIRP
jgi:tRNA-intron endonuclease, archaea type